MGKDASGLPQTGEVAVVVVTHDGSTWLPAVIDGIAEQGLHGARFIAVDTGSTDDSRALVAAAGFETISLDATAGYPEAVAAALEMLDGRTTWLWLLHDDSRPAAGALQDLWAAAHQHDAAIAGPKLREWPSLRRLLEVGVTISGTGARETGLEPGEYDQGQHDEVRDVLAVNTAGMLIRREALETLGGFDPALPVFGNDLDLGWRAARHGLRTIVVPDAVIFHAEAATVGRRSTALTGRHPHFGKRRAALHTLLANASGRSLPWRVLRLALGSLLRALGYLVTRSPRTALDELGALARVYGSPGEVAQARRARAEAHAAAASSHAIAPPDRSRDVLARWWIPYRHGLDLFGDVFAAATAQAGDATARRQEARAIADPSSSAARRLRSRAEHAGFDDFAEGDDSATGVLDDPDSMVRRLLTNDPLVLAIGFVLLALGLTTEAWGDVSGTYLSPVPEEAGSWWAAVVASGPVAPAYLVALAALGSLVGASAAVSLLFVAACPVALWGAWRFLGGLGRTRHAVGMPRSLVVWGAVTYATAILSSGLWGAGRLGPVVLAAVLPWLAHAALGLGSDDPDRRARAAWRTGGWLTIGAAFFPVAWFVAFVVAAGVLLVSRLQTGDLARERWQPTAIALGVPVVLLAFWWLPLVVAGNAAALLVEIGASPDPGVVAGANGLEMLTGATPAGAPFWVGVAVPLTALAGLAVGSARPHVRAGWAVASATLFVGLLLVVVGPVELPGGAAATSVVGLTTLLFGAMVMCVAVAAYHPGRPFRIRRSTAPLALLLAAVPISGLVWFAQADRPALTSPSSEVPAYMSQEVLVDGTAVAVLRGSVADGVSYQVIRDDGVRLGEDEVLLTRPTSDRTEQALARATSAVAAADGPGLAEQGIRYVVLPAPVDPALAENLDSGAELVPASAGAETRAWQLSPEAAEQAATAEPPSTSSLRVVWLVLTGLGLLVVLVLAAPTIRATAGGERR